MLLPLIETRKNFMIKILITTCMGLFICNSTFADKPCETYIDCTQKVLKAQDETKQALDELNKLSQNYSVILSRLDKLTEEVTDNKTSISKIPKLVNRGIIKTLSVKSNSTGRTDRGALNVTTSEGFCALSQIGGRFDGSPERIAVYHSGGEWYYKFNHGAASIYGTIICIAFSQDSVR